MNIQCPRCLYTQQPNVGGILAGSLADARALAALMPSTFAAREIVCSNERCRGLFPIAALRLAIEMRERNHALGAMTP